MTKRQLLNYLNKTSATESWDFLAAYCRYRNYEAESGLFYKYYNEGIELANSISRRSRRVGNWMVGHYEGKLKGAVGWSMAEFNVVSITMTLSNGQKILIKWA